MRQRKYTERITVTMPVEMKLALYERAYREGVSVSALLRRITENVDAVS